MAFGETRVAQIGEGDHLIRRDVDKEYQYQSWYRRWPEDYSVAGDPAELSSRIVEQLAAHFPNVRRVVFKEAEFRGGSLTALELDYLEGPIGKLDFGGDGGLLDFDGHVFRFGSRRDYSGTADRRYFQSSFNFFIEDRGSLRIVKNKLEHTSTPRNGHLSVRTTGESPRAGNKGTMVGFVDYRGSNPGELVAASLEVARQVVKEQNYPLWLKNSR